MSSENLAVPAEETRVKVSAKCDGKDVFTIIPVRHPKGVPEGQVIANALQMFKQGMGGIIEDTLDGKMNFYMASKLDAPITFEIQKVNLIHGSL